MALDGNLMQTLLHALIDKKEVEVSFHCFWTKAGFPFVRKRLLKLINIMRKVEVSSRETIKTGSQLNSDSTRISCLYFRKLSLISRNYGS